ncbi:hypothetical protein M0R72_08005 [Candidatus Pacearchaeota archaeon]|jgi:hypothetical protein|nr:hypothetical protein [Candidatus Pacearchaeota archaeon]
MPISPDKKHLYAENWKEIRARILERAENKCEFCGVPNHVLGFRDSEGEFWCAPTEKCYDPRDIDFYLPMLEFDDLFAETPGAKLIRIVLTIAHLDNDPTNNDEDNNLRALCQKCHNKHDVPYRKANRSHTRATKSESQGQERMI